MDRYGEIYTTITWFGCHPGSLRLPPSQWWQSAFLQASYSELCRVFWFWLGKGPAQLLQCTEGILCLTVKASSNMTIPMCQLGAYIQKIVVATTWLGLPSSIWLSWPTISFPCWLLTDKNMTLNRWTLITSIALTGRYCLLPRGRLQLISKTTRAVIALDARKLLPYRATRNACPWLSPVSSPRSSRWSTSLIHLAYLSFSTPTMPMGLILAGFGCWLWTNHWHGHSRNKRWRCSSF